MTNEIKKGDLVMIVKPLECCGNTRCLGKVDTVSSEYKGFVTKCTCGEIVAIEGFFLESGGAIDRRRLIKINPPAAELQKETHDEHRELSRG